MAIPTTAGASGQPWSRMVMAGLLLGLVLRVAVIASPGTPDVPTWKTWSHVGSTDPLGLYGVGGTPPERRLLRWTFVEGTTEYPPLGLYELSLVGAAYRLVDPQFRDSIWLTVLIKTPGLVAELALVVGLLGWGWRLIGAGAARWLAMAIWLNPAIVISGAALGYLDAQMAMPLTAALVAVFAGFPLAGGVLAAVALCTKPQAIFVGPALLMALARQSRVPVRVAFLRFTLGGFAAGLGILAPIIWHGAWANMWQALGRFAAHDMLSGFATNVWWLVTWLVRASYAAPVMGWADALLGEVRILSITRFMEVGFPDPKPWGAVLVLAGVAWGAWRSRFAASLSDWSFFAGWTVLTYFMWNTQVHENHLYLAVPLFALAAALDPARRTAFFAASAACAWNMYSVYGLGKDWPPVIQRSATVVDSTVLASLAVLGVWVWLTMRLPGRRGAQGVISASNPGGQTP